MTSDRKERMNELQIFNNAEFGQIRTVQLNNEVWFVASDICKALELSNTTMALERLDEDEKSKFNLGLSGGDTNCVNEYGLYNLVIASRKEGAKSFKRWITHEVIPSIRKNGGYIANQENLTPEQIVANALVVAQNILKQKDKQIEEMQPKVAFFNAVAESKTAISMNEVAKVLAIPGYGRNNLFEFLRNKKVLDRYNIPYQRYVDAGWFRVIEQKFMKNGEVCINTKTLVYQKGVDGIRRLVEQSN